MRQGNSLSSMGLIAQEIRNISDLMDVMNSVEIRTLDALR